MKTIHFTPTPETTMPFSKPARKGLTLPKLSPSLSDSFVKVESTAMRKGLSAQTRIGQDLSKGVDPYYKLKALGLFGAFLATCAGVLYWAGSTSVVEHEKIEKEIIKKSLKEYEKEKQNPVVLNSPNIKVRSGVDFLTPALAEWFRAQVLPALIASTVEKGYEKYEQHLASPAQQLIREQDVAFQQKSVALLQ